MFTSGKTITKLLNSDEKITVYKILTDVGFLDIRLKTKGKVSARMEDLTKDLPKAVEEKLNPRLTLPIDEN